MNGKGITALRRSAFVVGALAILVPNSGAQVQPAGGQASPGRAAQPIAEAIAGGIVNCRGEKQKRADLE